MLNFSKRKRKKEKDPTYRPGKENKKQRSANQTRSTESLLHLMGVAASPSKKLVVQHSVPLSPFKPKHGEETFTVETCIPSTPSKEGLSPPSLYTPRNKSRLVCSRNIQCDDGELAIFICEDKAKTNALPLPVDSNEWVKNFTDFSATKSGGTQDFKITKAAIENVNRLSSSRRRKGIHPRLKSQQDTMGMAASRALRKAEISVESREAHWVHFIPFEFIGDEGQSPDNLGIGLKYANGAMELINRTLREILFDKANAPEALYLSAIPKWKAGYENIRLLESLTYTVKSSLDEKQAKFFSITFEMLNRTPVCITDIDPIAKLLKRKFLNTIPLPSIRPLLFSLTAKENSSHSNDTDLSAVQTDSEDDLNQSPLKP